MKANDKKIFTCPHCKKKLRYPAGKHIRFTCPNCNTPYEVIPDEDGQSIINTLEISNGQGEHIFSNDEIDLEKENKFLDFILEIFSFLLCVPLFFLLHRILPNPDWVFNLDRILLALGVLIVVTIFVFYLTYFTVSILFILIMGLTIGSIRGGHHYGWNDFFLDYKATIYNLNEKNAPVEKELIISKQILPRTKQESIQNKIYEACDYKDSVVRNFAIKCLVEDTVLKKEAEKHQNYRTEIQAFAICKYINSHWFYVYDPEDGEYIAKASESAHHLGGDCEDHAIFMAACIKSIGGTPRIILSKGHAYPELRIEKSDFETIQYIIKERLFQDELSQGIRRNPSKKLFYHSDGDYIWLNLDYTNVYPGAPFLNNDSIIDIIDIQ